MSARSEPTAPWSCCFSTASTTSTLPPATANPSCGSGRGWAATAKQFFLATKTGERTYRRRATRSDRSLERLRVDQVDLIQLHNLAEPESGKAPMGPGGALEAAVEARDEGLVRFIGVTGHGITIAACTSAPGALRLRLGAAAVQLRADAESRSTPPISRRWRRCAPSATWRCRRSRRSPARRGASASTPPTPGTSRWRSRPISTWLRTGCWAARWVFLNTAGDVNLLPKVIAAANSFDGRPSDDTMQRLVLERSMEPLFV